jgi:RimJ/RimL family protein N-acetyltransferase
MPSAPTLRGSRFALRPWRHSDAPALAPACGDADICRFTRVPLAYSPAAAEAWIAAQRRRVEDGSAVVLAIEPAGGDLPVGMAGVFGLGEPQPEARLGYWLIRAFRGQRLARDAAQLLTTWALTELGLQALHADIEPDNVASKRVAQALGARPSGQVPATTAGRLVMLDRYTIVPRTPLRRRV